MYLALQDLLVWPIILATHKHTTHTTVADHSKWSAPQRTAIQVAILTAQAHGTPKDILSGLFREIS